MCNYEREKKNVQFVSDMPYLVTHPSIFAFLVFLPDAEQAVQDEEVEHLRDPGIRFWDGAIAH